MVLFMIIQVFCLYFGEYKGKKEDEGKRRAKYLIIRGERRGEEKKEQQRKSKKKRKDFWSYQLKPKTKKNKTNTIFRKKSTKRSH